MTVRNNAVRNFNWFVGVVEDRQDPLKLGRVKVRCFGYHTDVTCGGEDGDDCLDTEHLPWAEIGMPPTSASIEGIGRSPTGLVEGSYVYGFFKDGPKTQEPIILGTLWGISPYVGKPEPSEEEDFIADPSGDKQVYETKGFIDHRTYDGKDFSCYPAPLSTIESSPAGEISLLEDFITPAMEEAGDTTLGENADTAKAGVKTEKGEHKEYPQSHGKPDHGYAMRRNFLKNEVDVHPLARGSQNAGADEEGNITYTDNTAETCANADPYDPAEPPDPERPLPLGTYLQKRVEGYGGAYAAEDTELPDDAAPSGEFLTADVPKPNAPTWCTPDSPEPGFGMNGTSGCNGDYYDPKGSEGSSWKEPLPTYNAQYPFNHVTETESGHIFEVDDTPGWERLHIMHKTGSYFEFHPDGSRQSKVIGNNYEVVENCSAEYVGGTKYETIGGAYKLKVNNSKFLAGHLDIEVESLNSARPCNINLYANGGNVQVISRKIDGGDGRSSGGNILLNAEGHIKMIAGGKIEMYSKQDMAAETESNMYMLAENIYLNPRIDSGGASA